MAKKQIKENAMVVKKNYWSTISIWWAILVFLIAIPVVLIGFVMLDYNPYMEGVVEYKPLVEYAEKLELEQEEAIRKQFETLVEDLQESQQEELNLDLDIEVEPTFELYIEGVKKGEITKEYNGGMFGITTMLVSKMDMSFKTLELIKTGAFVLGGLVFSITFIYLFAKLICAKKTSWTFYDGAVIYKKGRIFYTEENTRDMEFFPGMSVSIRRSLKGKLFGYGDVILSNGAGEAGEIIMAGVKRPRKAQKELRELLAMACTRTANMMSPYKMYPQMYRHVLGGYPAYYYGAMQAHQQQPKK